MKMCDLRGQHAFRGSEQMYAVSRTEERGGV